MPFLLDVNVLIARTDPRHEHHERVRRWEGNHPGELLVTCPLTENGFVRIYGHPQYPGGPGSPAEAMVELQYLRALPVHRFIPDSLSLAERRVYETLKGIGPRQLTDIYLLGLAVQHGIRFATTDSAMEPSCVHGGNEALYVIPG